jgi:hypothetical protein
MSDVVDTCATLFAKLSGEMYTYRKNPVVFVAPVVENVTVTGWPTTLSGMACTVCAIVAVPCFNEMRRVSVPTAAVYLVCVGACENNYISLCSEKHQTHPPHTNVNVQSRRHRFRGEHGKWLAVTLQKRRVRARRVKYIQTRTR